ncbi:MAG: autotransporter outer membrane beta-barrel domain-containing protein [Beijerinckiaceae bacterium]
MTPYWTAPITAGASSSVLASCPSSDPFRGSVRASTPLIAWTFSGVDTRAKGCAIRTRLHAGTLGAKRRAFRRRISNWGIYKASVNATASNSFQTTLGVRLTSRIAMGTYGTLIPELRLGWNHEFLDASQTISASLIGVAGSSFSATGIAFGRDTALIGAGLSLELAPDAKVFVDYDGRIGSRLQEHSISGGLRVRF